MSIRKIAAIAGVSTATVSRALNGRIGVQEKIVQKVTEAASSLGYVLPEARRYVAKSRDRPSKSSRQFAMLTIGAAQDWLLYPGMAKVFSGIRQAAAASGHRVVLEELSNLYQPRPLLRLGRIEGAIVFVAPRTDAKVRDEFFLKASENVPLVWVLGAPTGVQVVDHVTYDSFAVGRLAFQYLPDCKCKSLAYFAERPDWRIFRLRGHAFVAAAREERRRATAYLVSTDPFVTDSFAPDVVALAEFDATVDRLLTERTRPLGIFVEDDTTVVKVQQALQRRGVRLGADVHLISCDNEQVRLAALTPRPASIDLSGELIGQAAVMRLRFALHKRPAVPLLTMVPPKLGLA